MLGPVEVHRDGTDVNLGTRKQRALVAALALHRGRPVGVDALIDLLWGNRPPTGVTGTLQSYVSGVRRALEPGRSARTPPTVLVTVEPGYALQLPDDAFDAVVFDRLVTGAERMLAPTGSGASSDHAALSEVLTTSALTRGELVTIIEDLQAALASWRGLPYAELEDAPAAAAERTRLEEVRLIALEELAVASLALGRQAAVAADLEALTDRYPLRERLWALRALALTRAGRQAEALETLQRIREILDEELGIEPGVALRELTTAVLRQDPALSWVPPREDPTHEPYGPRPHRPAREEAQSSPAASAAIPVTPTRHGPDPPPVQLPAAHWPMVGRDRELAALTGLLDQAEKGRASFAAVTGDAGMGKSRLCRELAAEALARGATVLLGRCSQDDGAPPLWPWATVLAGLGRSLPVGVGEADEGSQFRSWETIIHDLTDAARDAPIVVILDDLHWADPASLRVLRLLAETTESGRLLVIGTWRSIPPPDGLLADVVESLARRHALRLTLSGLAGDDGGRIVAAIAGISPTSAQAAALRDRTDGNPFFFVEYARLARERRDLGALVAEPEPPAGVSDVLARRLQRLPPETIAVLRAAAVVGRHFDTASVAAAGDVAEDDLLDRLDPALAAGLIREQGIDRFAFAHALVRDTIRATLPATRAARTHARVAAHLTDTPGREVEAAHHWLASGPSHCARAWPAAVAAARYSSRVHAHEQTMDLLREALRALESDPAASAQDRYAVLMDLVEASRWAGDWTSLVITAEQAMAVADRIGDVTLLARAASAGIGGGLWQTASQGAPHAGIVAALRRALDGLPAGDSVDRCRAMVALATETYYVAPLEERSDLVDGAIAMAERIGDEANLLDIYSSSFVPLWCPATMRRRLALAEETTRRARRLADEPALVVGLTFLAVAQCELGLVDQMRRTLTGAREHAELLRLPYALIVLANLELPWLAMAGRFDEARARLTEIDDLHHRMGLEVTVDALRGAQAVVAQWQGDQQRLQEIMLGFEPGHLPVASTVAALLARQGREQDAREHLAWHPVDLSIPPWWFSMLEWCMSAEVGARLGDEELSRTAYSLLEPYAGCVCVAGSGSASGPVDIFLAMGAIGAGDRVSAARHARRAGELLEAWQLPLAAQWWHSQRDLLGI